jgi:hypothetical protein
VTDGVAASVKARLLNKARVAGEEFERTLTRFAAERVLYRLGASPARQSCVLKGASLLAVWLPDPYRATRDVDLLAAGRTDDAAIRDLVVSACAVPCPEDGLSFDLSALVVDEIRADQEYVGKRARSVAQLGSARVAVQIDFGFGDAVVPPPEEIDYPTMLPGMPAPRLLAYPRETAIAEKFWAMVDLDTRNSRMKDFHDVWALATTFAFDGERVRAAVEACFARRRTEWTAEAPRPLTPAFYRLPELAQRWTSYLAAGAVVVPPPRQFETIGEVIRAFLGPVRDGIVSGNSFDRAWAAGGPWTSRPQGKPA